MSFGVSSVPLYFYSFYHQSYFRCVWYVRIGFTAVLYILVLLSLLRYLFLQTMSLWHPEMCNAFIVCCFTSSCRFPLPVISVPRYLNCLTCFMIFPAFSSLHIVGSFDITKHLAFSVLMSIFHPWESLQVIIRVRDKH